MLINEIVSLNEHDLKTRKAVRAALAGSGFKPCGSGDDSLVYSKDKATVVKVIVPTDIRNTSQQTSEKLYKQFLDFCAQVQRGNKNPHLPEVKELPKLKVGDMEFAQYEMPKYRPLSSEEYDVIDDMSIAIMNRRETFKQFLYNAQKSHEYSINQIRMISSQESLYRVITALTAMAVKIGAAPDITGHNVMKKPNGVLVVIDPWLAHASLSAA